MFNDFTICKIKFELKYKYLFTNESIILYQLLKHSSIKTLIKVVILDKIESKMSH